jgi:hypothetical protein
MTRLLLLLSLASLACIAPAAMVAPTPPVSTVTAVPTVTQTEQVFTTTGYVYIRDAAGLAIDYLEPGETVTCTPAGDYCILSDTSRIWRGCLSPNPLGLGCKER